MNCNKCKTPVPDSKRCCPACETVIGFPNVRAAQKEENMDALKKRIDEAFISTKARDCDNILKDFGNTMKSSKAILCSNLSVVCRVMKSDNELIATFYQQVESNSRLPEDNKWDNLRESVESILFPHYHKEIHYAFVALDNNILNYYGDYGLILKENMISERSTVFEENCINFFEKHKVAGIIPIPNGYRAIWGNRDMIAIAKLHSKFDSITTEKDFAKILFNPTKNKSDVDFIEVHIYGSIHRRSVECVLAKMPKKRADKILLKSLKRDLEKEDIFLETIE